MRLSSLAYYGIEAAKNPSVLIPSQPLFLISHMRSYSSVLVNILCSNKEIYGGTEMLQSFKTYGDLVKLQIKAYQLQNRKARIVIDKILNDQYQIHLGFLKAYRPLMIFTVRDPVDSIASILSMYSKYTSMSFSNAEVCEYYIQRQMTLRRLLEWSREVGLHSISFRAEMIVDSPDLVLASLSDFLHLEEELTPTYKLHPMVGVEGKGDPSPTIQEGRIVKKPKDKISVPLDDEVIRTLHQSMNETLASMRANSEYLE
ncbi:MAG: sulfotransferase [Bacteroidota bacterium]